MTSLSRQLKKLATPQSNLLDHKRKKCSLLFSATDAANYSREILYKIGYSGFVELLEINPQFDKFKATLFDRNTIEFQRTVQSIEVNKRLDESIEEFLLLISPYLQKHASLKAMEWLIQRYLVNEMNVDALMMCIIPYYESVIFTRILQLIDLRSSSSPWKWLHNAQIKGVVINKQIIFLQWQSNVWFRNFVANYLIKIMKAHRIPDNLRIAVSFFISTQIGGVISCEKVTEDHIASICQTFNQAFTSNNEELISGMLLLSGQLAVKASFAGSFSDLILSTVSEIKIPELAENCALCMLTVCHYQLIEMFSARVVKNFEENQLIIQKMENLSYKKAIGCFVIPYSCGLLNLLCENKSSYKFNGVSVKKRIMSLVSWIQSISLTPLDSAKVISKFMNKLMEYTEYLSKMHKPLDFTLIWKELEKSHPEGADRIDIPSLKLLSIQDKFEIEEANEIELNSHAKPGDKSKESVDIESWLQNYSMGDVPKSILSASFKFIKNFVLFEKEKMLMNFWEITSDENDKFSQSLKRSIQVLSAVVVCQMKSKNIAICESILKEIFKSKLGNLKFQLRFLSVIWGWHSDIPVDLRIDVHLKLWALNLGSELLSSCSSSGSLFWVLSPDESLIFSLIPPMCDEGFLCQASFKVLRAIQSIVGSRLKENNFSALVEKFLQCEEEISSDVQYLPSSVALLPVEKKSAGVQIIANLINAVLSEALPLYLKCSTLFLLSQIDNIDILKKLIPLGGIYLEKVQGLVADNKLDPLSSTLLYYILLRFSSKDAAFLNLDGGWKMFSRVLEMTRPVLQVTGETIAPQDLVVNYKVLQSISNSNKQCDILDVLISRTVCSEDSIEASKLKRELKKINIETSVIVSLLGRYNLQPKLTSIKEARAKKFKMQKTIENDGSNKFQLENLQKLSLVVELTGIMDGLKEPWMLINPLCNHLKLSFELEVALSDTFQQQILSVLYHLLQNSMKILSKSDFIRHVKESVVVLSVQCIRQSVNPDTHRRALLILALISNYFPEKVLHNIMAIFTFMGTSLLKRDDSYSFHVIHETISSIVPTLIQAESSDPTCLLVKLAQVTQVFVDALPDLAEHRKLPLFSQLAKTLGVSQYLWLVMALIADSFVRQSINENAYTSAKSAGIKGLPPSIQFALLLYSQFPVADQLQASYEVLNFACKLPDDKDAFKDSKPKDRDPSSLIINIETHTTKQLRQLKHTCIGLLCQLISSERFVGQIYQEKLEENESEFVELRVMFEKLLEMALNYIKVVSTQEILHKGKPNARFWNDMQRKLMDLVNAINSLLPPSSFAAIITNLLSTNSSLIRGRAMEILASKLQVDVKFFGEGDACYLTPFLDILRIFGASKKEIEENRQIALYTLQLLVKFLGSLVNAEIFMPVMETGTELAKDADTPNIVKTQAILVVAESATILKAYSIPYLNELMPSLLNLLNEAVTQGTNLDTRAVASASAIQKIVESIPQFLTKEQLESLVETNCKIISMFEEAGQKDSRLIARFSNVLDLIIEKIEPRNIIKVLTKAYNNLVPNCLSALPTLMVFIEKFIGSIPNEELTMFKQNLINLFTSALDIRSLKGMKNLIAHSEASIVSALSRFLLRLNEDDNITIFTGFVNWAWKDQEKYPGRLLTFFRFSDTLVGKLKVLFIKAKLANSVFSYAAKTLEQNNSENIASNTFGKGKEADELTCLLLNYTLDALTKIFLYDSVKFTTEEKFNVIVTPLMNQLENTIGTEDDYKSRMNDHLKPCIIKLASAAADDFLWKELNRQLLLRVKPEDDPKVVLAALDIFESIIESLGEDYLQPLLADTMPHITEVLESSDFNVEEKSKEIFTKMEAILGDNLKAYLDS